MSARKAALVAPCVVVALLAVPLPGQAGTTGAGATPPGTTAGAAGPGSLGGPADGAPEKIAVSFLRDAAADYGVAPDDVADLEVRSSYRSRHNGVTHVNVFQRFEGKEVFGATATVNVAADGSVVHVGETLVADLAPAERPTAVDSPVEAVEAAAEALDLEEPEDLEPLAAARAAGTEVTLTDGGISDEPIPTRLGWQPTEDGLRPAYQVVIDDATDVHLYNAVVDAETGELLELDDWTIEHDHDTLASTLARGGDAHAEGEAHGGDTHAEGEAHAEGDAHEGEHSGSTHGTNDPVDDGSTYRVYEIPKESPNDGPRTLVSSPADGIASPFGWHDVDGVAGPEYTTTRGTNVHAYLDRDNDNQPDPGGDVDGGASLTFDQPLDLGQSPLTYQDAAVTNLFYMNNVIHDVMHLYGFDEQAGNFQVNNLGRGGVGGDYVRAEAQDGGGVNNANMSTPAADGLPPRMQMYLWNPSGGVLPNQVVVDQPSPAAGVYGATAASFGPALTDPLTGSFALGQDASGTLEACGPLVDFPAGAIAVVDRGTCPFTVKVLNAQAAGATAVVVANNAVGAPITLGGSAPGITIPAVMVTQADGATLRAGLPATGAVRPNPDVPPQRDGDLENGIIIHEYGHGISLRLTGGPGVNCLTGQEQMGEGWSDYYAITMLLDPALDDPEGPRGMGPYAVYEDSRAGDGIRPRPYSRDMEIQPFTYDRIKTGAWITGGSLSVPHGIGHGWSSVLWDMTWNLVDRHGFNDNIYDPWNAGGNNRAMQYVTDGLKMQGCAPGFVAGRDGILAAVEALGGEDTCLVWSTFARRGLGVSAEQGTTGRDDNTEAFDIPAECVATGDGFAGMNPQGGTQDLLLRGAGDTVKMSFALGSYEGMDVLADNVHATASQQVDCTTQAPVQFAVTTPAAMKGGNGFRYNRGQGTYDFMWDTDEAWAGTCRQFVVTLDDGTQHRVDVQFAESD